MAEPQPAPRHVAIIGCGFSGTSAFHQLVERRLCDAITIFEASGDFGPGYAYRTDECADYLINNTADTMCLTPATRGVFADWLAAHPDVAPRIARDGHPSRAAFGLFLKDAFELARAKAERAGIAVRLIAAEATGLTEDADGVTVTWNGGATRADVALLTTGRCPDLGERLAPRAAESARHLPTHMNTPELDALPLDAAVHVLGASLSAYDVINRLYAPATGRRFARDADGTLTFEGGPNTRTVALCSRSGRLKKPQSRTRARFARRVCTRDAIRGALASSDPLDALLTLVRAEAEAQGAAIDWNAVLDPYAAQDGADDNENVTDDITGRAADVLTRDITAARAGGAANFLVDLADDAQIDLWDAFAEHTLPPEEERRYRRAIESALLTYAAPCPLGVAEQILALIRAGRLRVIRRVQEVVAAPEDDAFFIRTLNGVERATTLINTTGAVARRVDDPVQPALIRDLAEEGLLAPYARTGLGAEVDMATFRAAGAERIYVANMLLWGPGIFTSSAFTMAVVVERILRGLYPGAFDTA